MPLSRSLNKEIDMKNSYWISITTIIITALTFAKEVNAMEPSKVQSNSQLTALEMTAPSAKKVTKNITYHGDTRNDQWFWLRDADYPNKVDDEEVLTYLKAENDYFATFKKQNIGLINTLFEEFKGRVDETETSVPYQSNGYEYRWAFNPGQEYKTWYRKPLSGGEEKVFLDGPALAKGKKYFVIDEWAISPNNQFLAYSIDTNGDERYTIYVYDLKNEKLLADEIPDSNGELEFSSDSQHLLYGALEQDKWRTKSINSHRLGDKVKNDKVIYEETDDRFFLTISKTRDGKFILIKSATGTVTEVRALKSDMSKQPMLMASRDLQFDYDVEHAHNKFYITANDKHVNSRVAWVKDINPSYENWQTLIAGNDDVYYKDIATFDSFMALKYMRDGLQQIDILDYQGKSYQVEFPESVFAVSKNDNPDFFQTHLRVSYQSMITPPTIYDIDIKSKSLKERKVVKIPSGYDKSQYVTKRIMAPARDGAKVPVTMFYKKGTKLDGTSPLHLYAYGAYGSGMSPKFSTMNKSLADRSVIYALAHIRGGDEMGYQWYLDGKLEKRTNTFNDFVDVAKHLIKQDYTSAGNISISGRSAGGELMGAAVIQAPELWSSVILGVPFVDVLNTMLDPTLPLTPPEWSEWGNPIEDKDAYHLIKSYSPYDQIEARRYPPMLVTGGLYDPRVTYWEPAKWTAKMRALKTDDNLLIMRMNMGAGHFANSGRYGRLMDYAEEMAFSLLSHGITK